MATLSELQAQLEEAITDNRESIPALLTQIIQSGFHGCDGLLRGLDLRHLNLWMDFCGADMADSDFSYSYLYESTLDDCNLENTLFEKANLGSATLWNVHLQKAILNYCNAHRVSISGSCRSASFQYADLRASNLGGDLRECNFLGANLMNAWIGFADLRGVTFRKATLLGVILKEVVCDETTILPDGTFLRTLSDFQRFIDANHPEFWPTAS